MVDELAENNPAVIVRDNKDIPSKPVVEAPKIELKVKTLEKNNEILSSKNTKLIAENMLLTEKLGNLEKVLLAAESRFGATGWAVTDSRVLYEKLKTEYKEKYARL